MWKKTHMKFLTQTDFDNKLILKTLENYDSSNLKKEDAKILKNILNDFYHDDYSLLDTQEFQFLKKNPNEIWAEYLLNRYKFDFYENNPEKPDFPLYLILEPVSICNLRCPFCHQVDEKFTKNKSMMGMMDVDLFKKIIDDAQEGGTKAITLTCRGEPTLHPHLGEMLEYCKDKFIEFKMNTNATKLTEKLIHQILKSELSDIVFSVDSYYKEEFESLRVGANFEEVLSNIKKFKEIKEKFYPNSRCVTRISGVQVSDKQNPKKFQEFWEQYVDFVVMVKMLTRWDLYKNSKDQMRDVPCHYLGRSLSIYFDGTVIPCDMDYQGVLALGSLKELTIQEVWNGKKHQELFLAHRNGKRDSIFPCDRCPA